MLLLLLYSWGRIRCISLATHSQTKTRNYIHCVSQRVYFVFGHNVVTCQQIFIFLADIHCGNGNECHLHTGHVVSRTRKWHCQLETHTGWIILAPSTEHWGTPKSHPDKDWPCKIVNAILVILVISSPLKSNCFILAISLSTLFLKSHTCRRLFLTSFVPVDVRNQLKDKPTAIWYSKWRINVIFLCKHCACKKVAMLPRSTSELIGLDLRPPNRTTYRTSAKSPAVVLFYLLNFVNRI